MNCPRCGASGFTGVCDECGFPITKVNKIRIKKTCDIKMFVKNEN